MFRAGFIDDEFVKTLPQSDAYNRKKNKFLDSIIFVGPVRVDDGEGEPQEDPHLRSGVGPRVRRDRSSTDLARRAYRRPPTRAEVDVAAAVRGSREGRTASPPSRACSSPSRRCWCRRISCSASSAIPIRAIPRSCTRCRRSSWRRASATSCGARCPTTSCWRSPRRASCATRACSRRRSKRMLADPRAVGVRRELRRPVARDAQPRRRQAGSGQVQGVEPRAARRDEDRDDDVLRARAAREPSGQRLPERGLHVPQRAAREALRHRGRQRARVPPRAI